MSGVQPNMKTLAMYRRFIKSLMVVFKNDYEMFHKCRIAFRKDIESKRDVTDPQEINTLLFNYEESRRLLL